MIKRFSCKLIIHGRMYATEKFKSSTQRSLLTIEAEEKTIFGEVVLFLQRQNAFFVLLRQFHTVDATLKLVEQLQRDPGGEELLRKISKRCTSLFPFVVENTGNQFIRMHRVDSVLGPAAQFSCMNKLYIADLSKRFQDE